MKKISFYLALSMSIVMGIIGIGVGYALTPQYQTTMYEKYMDLGRADRTFDLRYTNAMIAHHRGAMLLAEQLQKNTSRPELKALASDILVSEPKLIEELYSWKKVWYKDNRKVKDPIVANLGAADDKFDLRFLNAMIAHHEAGIEMTKETRVKSSRAEVLNNADAVEAFLKGGVNALSELRTNWYNF